MPCKDSPEFTLRLSAPILWALIMLWLSLTPSPPQLPGILGWDKLLHAGAYGLLSLLILQFLHFRSSSSGKAWWQAGLVAVCYGALLEIMQFLTQTGRTAEWWDLFADAVGALLCCVIFRRAPVLTCARRDELEHDGSKNADG